MHIACIRLTLCTLHVADFNTRNKWLTQKLLKQGYRYHKPRKTFSKFYRRYYDMISKFQVGLKAAYSVTMNIFRKIFFSF